MSRMLVHVYRVFEVTYHGDEFREQALNALQVSARASEGAGPAGSYVTKETTVRHPSETFAITVLFDEKE